MLEREIRTPTQARLIRDFITSSYEARGRALHGFLEGLDVVLRICDEGRGPGEAIPDDHRKRDPGYGKDERIKRVG